MGDAILASWGFVAGGSIALVLWMLWDYYQDGRPQRGDDGEDPEP